MPALSLCVHPDPRPDTYPACCEAAAGCVFLFNQGPFLAATARSVRRDEEETQRKAGQSINQSTNQVKLVDCFVCFFSKLEEKGVFTRLRYRSCRSLPRHLRPSLSLSLSRRKSSCCWSRRLLILWGNSPAVHRNNKYIYMDSIDASR